MRPTVVLLFAVRTLAVRRVRTLLALASIALAVFTLAAIHTAGLALVEAQRRTYADTGQPDVVASVPGLTPTMLAALTRRPGVRHVEARTVQPSRVTAGGRWFAVRLVGIARFEDTQLDRPLLVAGRWPEQGEVVLDVSARRILHIDEGALVAFQANPADPIRYARVSGFAWVPARPDASLLNQLTAYLPERDLRQALGLDTANTLLVKVSEPRLAGQVAAELQRFLAARQVASYGWVVRDPDSFLGARELRTLVALLRAFAVLGALVACFIVANTMLGLLAEERAHIGTLRALGATRPQIGLLYLSPALVLGIAGSLLGFVLGSLAGSVLSSYLAGLAGLIVPDSAFAPSTLVFSCLAGFGIAGFGAVLPVVAHARTSTAQLLRGDAARTTRGSRWIGVTTRWLAARSPILAMSLRDPFRRPWRTGLAMLMSTIALSALLASQLVDHSIRVTVDELYQRYRADAWLLTNPPVSPTYAHRLAAAPPVRSAEPWMLMQGAVGAVRTDVWGIPRDTQVYQPRLIAGSWLTASHPPAAVLTSNLARRIGARIDDVLALDLGPRRIPVRVVGIVDDESTYLGASAIGKIFLDRRALTRLLGRDERTALYAVQFWESTPRAAATALDYLERRERAVRPTTLLMAEDRAATDRVLAVLTVLARAVVIVVGLAALFGVANALLLDVTERRRELGVLRSIGSDRRVLITLLLGQTLVIVSAGAVLAGSLGVALGAGILALTSAQLFHIPPHLDGRHFAIVAAAAWFSAGLAVLVPAMAAARLRPVEVLRYE
ncbi:MAG: FtsX-like permease family protein [Thermomicrobium sp.]|nr:FtsX-like permease family protein [Thermomicrobium sp.]